MPKTDDLLPIGGIGGILQRSQLETLGGGVDQQPHPISVDVSARFGAIDLFAGENGKYFPVIIAKLIVKTNGFQIGLSAFEQGGR